MIMVQTPHFGLIRNVSPTFLWLIPYQKYNQVSRKLEIE